MKKIAIVGAVVLLLATAVPAMAGPPKMPPPGEHYTFNCVTEAGPFSDTFDGDLSQWTNISGSGAIVEDNGNNVYGRTGGSYVGAVVAVTGSESWDDYVFEFDVKKVSGNYFNVVFRYVDQNNHYLLEPSADEVHIALFKKVGGGGYTELTATRPLQNTTPSIWYHYKIVVQGDSIKIYVDDVLKFDVTDTSLSAGKIGVGAYAGSTVYFDNVYVEGPNVKVMGANEILVPVDGYGKLGFKEGSPFQILDNDMTDGQAWVQVPAGFYDTYDQARGKPGGDLFWGNYHARAERKPVWEQHNDPLNWWSGRQGNWKFTNNGVTCYSFRLYPLQ
ncbi:MAG: DUF1080 domain-containing protein [Dehalococcoidia bacterium]|nr:MAG: DUF1080 domain-containing protein [Dehalococcoidia bacterium]